MQIADRGKNIPTPAAGG